MYESQACNWAQIHVLNKFKNEASPELLIVIIIPVIIIINYSIYNIIMTE